MGLARRKDEGGLTPRLDQAGGGSGRILLWSEHYLPRIGGAEVLAARLISALRERGYEFLVVSRQDGDDLPAATEQEGVPVRRLPYWAALARRDLDRVLRLRREVAALKRAFRPDLVHLYQLGPLVVFERQTASVAPAPTLITLHSAGLDRFVQPETVLGETLRSADWIVTCSAAVLSRAREQVPEISARSSVILNSLEMPALLPVPLPFDPPRLLCLGRLVRQKGFDLALTAFGALRERFPTARLVVAGDGVERPALEAQAASLGLASAVDFLGWVSPEVVAGLLNTATVVLMPSRWEEPFGLVALQASQMARPIVATRGGGLPEVVVHGETGILIEREDSQALAEATARLLDHPQTARRLGAAGRRRAREVLNWERHVAAYDALYRRLIRPGSGADAEQGHG